MRKYFTFFIFLFAIDFSFAQDLSATLKMPEVLEPGSDYTVEVTIIKGTINSYIKFTQKLPPHFRASEIESSGGAFTFDDSIVKIVWFFPPAKNEFTFSYRVKVPKDVSGVKKIGGKVHYFFNTNREVFIFEKKQITVGYAKDILAAKEKLKNDSIVAANIAIKKILESVITNTVVITKTDTTVTNLKAGQVTDSIASNKDTLTTPVAKIINRPSVVKDTLSAPVALVNKSVPTKDTLLSRTVKTTTLITSIEPETEDKKESVTGQFTYCVQLGTFKGEVPLELANKFFKISARGIKNFKDDNGFTTFTVGSFKTHDEAIPLKNEMLEKGFQGAFIIAVPTTKLPLSSKTSNPIQSTTPVNKLGVSVTTNTVVVNTKLESTTTKTETIPQTNAVLIPEKVEVTSNVKTPVNAGSTSANRTYRVQIGAFKEEVPLATANRFLKLSAKGIKNLKDNRGFTVYTVGDFSNRDEALILRNEMINKGFPDAFIVAFENGQIVK